MPASRPPPRKIANRVPNGPQRYRAGKPAAADVHSSEDEESDEEEAAPPAPAPKPAAPKPTATSFPKAAPKKPVEQPNEDEFETEESEEEEVADRAGSETSQEEDSSEEEESSSEDDTAKRRTLMRPMFVKKNQRNLPDRGANGTAASAPERSEDQVAADEEAQRKQRADELVQEQLDKQAAARAAGKKYWDDEEIEEIDDIDDTDDVDPEAEYAAWKLRELKRVKRDREALIAAEKEREEIERRRNMGEEEREEEDKEYLARQKEEKEGRGKMSYLQKYQHKGAFFQEEMKEAGLDKRDVMGAKFQDDVDRSVLPQYLQVRDMTKVGRKGRTKYKDLRNEDTGRWGEFGDRSRRREGDSYDGRDDRFMSDRDRERGAERTGANASALGERKRPGDGGGGESKRVKAS